MKTMPPETTGWLIAAIGTDDCQSMLPVLPSSASRNPAVVPGTGDGIAWLGGAPERACVAGYALDRDLPNVIVPPHACKAIASRPSANTRLAALTSLWCPMLSVLQLEHQERGMTSGPAHRLHQGSSLRHQVERR